MRVWTRNGRFSGNRVSFTRENRADFTHYSPPLSLITIAVACLYLLNNQYLRADNTFIVAPNSAASTDSLYFNAFPFDLGADTFEDPGQTERYQQVYASSQFSNVDPGGEWITALSFRPNPSFGAAFSGTLPDIRIDLSTTRAADDGLSTTFANNVGSNDTIVYGGTNGAALPLSSSATGPSGGPDNFDIVIQLSTPFFYNPANGNLLMDVSNYGGGLTTYFDAVDVAGDGVSRAYTVASGVNSSTADASDTLGLVTGFTFTEVPEPAAWVWLLPAIAAFGCWQRVRDTRKL